MVNQQFHNYFQREVTYLRGEGRDFAKRYPKVARRLDFSNVESSDPHVERLLQSFAFLTARLQQEAEDLFPRISTGLLETLYPQFLAPLPSFAIARLNLDDRTGKLTSRFNIQKGTELYTRSPDNLSCRFEVGVSSDIYPIGIDQCELIQAFDLPASFGQFKTNRLLKIHLKSLAAKFDTMGLKSLRFYINCEPTLQNKLYEGLFIENSQVAVTLGASENNQVAQRAIGGLLSPAGFNNPDRLLNHSNNSHPGYGLIQEYFAYPQSFMFFDINVQALAGPESEGTIYIALSSDVDIAPKDINKETFALACVPIINTYRKLSEPIRVDYRKHEYRLIADQRYQDNIDVHSIQRVHGSIGGRPETLSFSPFFSYTHADHQASQNQFWLARRTFVPTTKGTKHDMLLSFVDYDFSPQKPCVDTIYAEITCTNRHLAQTLPVGTSLSSDASLPAPTLELLSRPTPAHYLNHDTQSLWRLISQLSLSHLSYGGETGLPLLKELINLYGDFQDGRTIPEIDIIKDLQIAPCVDRIGLEAWRGFVQGTHITLTLNDNISPDVPAFLFMAILERAFSQFAALNSFTQLSLIKADQQKVWKTWAPRSGNQNFI